MESLKYLVKAKLMTNMCLQKILVKVYDIPKKCLFYAFFVLFFAMPGAMARMYLQTPLLLPEFLPIGQYNRFK